ncbi:MAG: PhzF family phenazine biosynthesis protein [Xanthomonadales bacterium]|nr:PhzF family phenazine biosynthesis protein [Xanthomonadales bacterium]
MTNPARRAIEIWRVNAFTDTPFTGNPAGVVPEALGLPDSLMQSIAKEVNDISETVFILPPETDEADLRMRFFTATTEVDLCGHATISALFTLHWRGDISGQNETRTLRVETRVGVLELGLSFEQGRLQWATMEQLVPECAPATGAHRAAEVLGLAPAAIAPRPEIGCCSSGLWVCFVPLTDVGQLAKIELRRELIEQLWPENPELIGVYAFAFVDEQTTQGRFFSPARYGILEDPVTGTASGALGGYLIANGLMPAGGVLYARQGVEMGRPGSVRVSRNANGRMSISGRAVAVIEGRVLV